MEPLSPAAFGYVQTTGLLGAAAGPAGRGPRLRAGVCALRRGDVAVAGSKTR
jgi:hypothetical protein